MPKKSLSFQTWILIGVVAGVAASLVGAPGVDRAAEEIAALFVRLLKLVSLPVIFLALLTTVGGIDRSPALRGVALRIGGYTLLTTVAAATVAWLVYTTVDPASWGTGALRAATDPAQGIPSPGGIWTHFRDSLPENLVAPFLHHNVLGVLFLALLISSAMMTLPPETARPLVEVARALFAVALRITRGVMALMPLAVAAFVVLFIRDLRQGLAMEALLAYLGCVVGANLIQASLVLPLLARSRGVSPLELLRAMAPALTVAFFTKSSTAALPTSLECAEGPAGVRRPIARLSLPLCAAINMNACAAFILITVLFVGRVNGLETGLAESLMWILIATVGALGNAAVPMGCYFLASSFLAAQDVPLAIMGAILPFYAVIDMLETAINVWSDACVTAMVDRDSGEALD